MPSKSAWVGLRSLEPLGSTEAGSAVGILVPAGGPGFAHTGPVHLAVQIHDEITAAV